MDGSLCFNLPELGLGFASGLDKALAPVKWMSGVEGEGEGEGDFAVEPLRTSIICDGDGDGDDETSSDSFFDFSIFNSFFEKKEFDASENRNDSK